MQVLLTGVSGVGKSAVVAALRAQGLRAYDADDDGFTAPDADGRWHWRTDAVAELLGTAGDRPLYFAGCSEEQADFVWDVVALLTAPEATMVERLRTRTTNGYGKSAAELAQVLADRREIEPRLRAMADLVVTTDQPVAAVTEEILSYVQRAERPAAPPTAAARRAGVESRPAS